MKDPDRKQPQVNPPKMSSHDLSKAEMEVRDLIEKNEKGEQMKESQKDPESGDDDSFHLNKKKEEDL